MLSNAPSYSVTESPGDSDYDGSVVGWQAGDTIITCGNTDTCNDFLTGIYSFGLNQFIVSLNTSGTLESTAAPEPRYWAPLLLFGGFMLIRKRKYEF